MELAANVSRDNYEALKASRDTLQQRVIDLEREIVAQQRESLLRPGFYIVVLTRIAPGSHFTGPFTTDFQAVEYLETHPTISCDEAVVSVRIEYQR